MRSSPSIVPGTDRDIYLVLDDFGSRLGRVVIPSRPRNDEKPNSRSGCG